MQELETLSAVIVATAVL